LVGGQISEKCFAGILTVVDVKMVKLEGFSTVDAKADQAQMASKVVASLCLPKYSVALLAYLVVLL
jgi:hypothetical protein